MPRPSARLDLFLVPRVSPDKGPAHHGFDALSAQGFTDSHGFAGPRAKELVEGGFVRARWDVHDHVRLFANGQGGFRGFCPACGRNVTDAVSHALGGVPVDPDVPLACACGVATPLAGVDYRPPAAFARWAFALCDVGHHALTDVGSDVFTPLIGPFHVIGRRVSA